MALLTGKPALVEPEFAGLEFGELDDLTFGYAALWKKGLLPLEGEKVRAAANLVARTGPQQAISFLQVGKVGGYEISTNRTPGTPLLALNTHARN